MADEYSTGGGGKLKLKGSKVSGGRVEKKKKKGSKKKDGNGNGNENENVEEKEKEKESPESGVQDQAKEDKDALSADTTPEPGVGKTETEKKYEETRRKRMLERLQRDGIKTHKERVEELNKYLSRLSEHHDMPKIGPG
ncbi:hypothetical protein N7520_009577 [Penicillium odoratum]|uniref:uncharacterized protein n=1 Tax=Penicillium odoratum TaxID=1167516 RepID=UPI002547D32B|nr:uncharacterized protein N7520_009577 [Penicillium odoratum]KAJ5752660.1 hypothetical protein N7520_009577 [Penicillium odoratum]